MKTEIIRCAQEAFCLRLATGTVSEHTKNASVVAKAWREACWALDPDRFHVEVAVHPSLNQRIDVLDVKEMCAYEFKVSGKNATSEFYKDVVKAILWNEQKPTKIHRLVFITDEEHGLPFLEAAMPQAFIRYVGRSGLEVEVVYVRRG